MTTAEGTDETRPESRWHGLHGFLISLIVHLVFLIALCLLFIPIEPAARVFLLLGDASRDRSIDALVRFDLVEPGIEEAPQETSNVDVSLDLEVVEITTKPIGEFATDAIELPSPSFADLEQLKSIVSSQPAESESKRGVQFFGSHAYGNKFAFVFDVSPSMNARGGKRFARAREELMSSIAGLEPSQSFYIFLFSYQTSLMFGEQQEPTEFLSATPENIDRVRSWLYTVRCNNGGTDPRWALFLAQKMSPDAVFLLSDGDFNQPTAPNANLRWFGWPNSRELVHHLVDKHYPNLPLHCIAFENKNCERAMTRLAEMTGGTSRFIPIEMSPTKPPPDVVALAHATLRRIDPDGKARTQPAMLARMNLADRLLKAGFRKEAVEMIAPVDPNKLSPRSLKRLHVLIENTADSK